MFSARSRMLVALNLVPPYLSLLSVSRQRIPWARTEQVCVLWCCFRGRQTQAYQAERIKHLLSFAVKINKKRNYTKKRKKENWENTFSGMFDSLSHREWVKALYVFTSNPNSLYVLAAISKPFAGGSIRDLLLLCAPEASDQWRRTAAEIWANISIARKFKGGFLWKYLFSKTRNWFIISRWRLFVDG